MSKKYPTPQTERKILEAVCKELGLKDQDFCKRHLVDWADIIRKTFYDGGIEEAVNAHYLVHIIQAYNIFGDKTKAIEVCVNRFDDDTKQAFKANDEDDADFVMPTEEDHQKQCLDEHNF